MFYHQESNQYILENTNFIINGIQYPSMWLNNSSPAEKEAAGIVEVKVVGQPKDGRYYFVSEKLEGDTLTYVNIPKDLDMVKSSANKQLKDDVWFLLSSSDWIELRNLRDPSYKPEWIKWRDQVRQDYNQYEQSITNAVDVDAIADLQIVWPEQPSE